MTDEPKPKRPTLRLPGLKLNNYELSDAELQLLRDVTRKGMAHWRKVEYAERKRAKDPKETPERQAVALGTADNFRRKIDQVEPLYKAIHTGKANTESVKQVKT